MSEKTFIIGNFQSSILNIRPILTKIRQTINPGAPGRGQSRMRGIG